MSVDEQNTVQAFDGRFEKGRTYRTIVLYKTNVGWWPEIPVRILPHHAVRIEWRNLENFPEMAESGAVPARHLAIFRVEDIEITRVSPQRWNAIYSCTMLAFDAAR